MQRPTISFRSSISTKAEATFVDPVPAVNSLNGIGVGDIDGDGIPDAVGANFYEYGISVALGLSDGGFSPWVITVPDTADMPDSPVFQPNGAPVVADFEGSGTPAIAVTSFDRIWLFWPLADGGLVPVVASDQHWGGGNYIRQLSVADFNGDGSPDLLVNFANVTAIQVAFNGCP